MNPSGGSNIINLSSTERFISVATGAFLVVSAFRHNRAVVAGIGKGLAGAFLLYRGLSGSCPLYNYLGKEGRKTKAINIRTTIMVNKPVQEVYALWRRLDNLPAFMHHLAAVHETDRTHSHWEVRVPRKLGKIVWNAKIVKEKTDQLLVWESEKNSAIENAGKIEFSEALGGKGTLLDVMITYRMPGGDIGRKVAQMLNPRFKNIISRDIMKFKTFAEN